MRQIYFTVTITMVTIFGVAEEDPVTSELDDLELTDTSHTQEDPHSNFSR